MFELQIFEYHHFVGKKIKKFKLYSAEFLKID